MGRILQDTHSFVGQIEKDHCSPKDTTVSDHVDVHHLGDSDQEEDYDLSHDPAKPHLTGKLLIRDRTHKTGNIICKNKYKQGEQKTVTSPQEVP